MRWLLKLFGVGGIPEQIRGALQDRLNAQNETQRIEADIKLATLQAQMTSHSIGGRWITVIQVAFALPFVIYNAKLVVYDKVFGWGVTDPLSPALYDLQTTVISFFFVSTTLRAVVGR
jgi:hypothetical protein